MKNILKKPWRGRFVQKFAECANSMNVANMDMTFCYAQDAKAMHIVDTGLFRYTWPDAGVDNRSHLFLV